MDEKREKATMIIYYLVTGYMHKVPKDKENEVLNFYKMYYDHGYWRNKRGDIVALEEEGENKK